MTSTAKNTHLHTFQNGLRLIYEAHTKNPPQTHIRAFCHVGSMHEPENIKGASHFIEHMCFKGSRSFPSWAIVNEPFSKTGAYFNATTTKQYTCFIVDCLDIYSSKFLKILGDIMLVSKFDKKEYQLELNVVKEEMKMKSQTSFIESLAFEGSVYEKEVDNIEYHTANCFPYDDVVDFYHKYYVPQNMVVSVVSSIPFNTIVRYITNTQFTKQLKRTVGISPIMNADLGTVDNEQSSCINYLFKSGNGDTATIEIGIRICDQFNDREFCILNVLRNVISNSMSSRLFVELREKRGLTYRSGAYINCYETVGIFVLYAISDVNRLLRDGKSSQPGVIPVLFNILDDLIQHGVKESEFKMAMQNIEDSLKMESIAQGDKSFYNGIRVMLHNDTSIFSNAKIFDNNYKNIKKSDVNDIIIKYFANKQYYLSIVGGKLPKTESFTSYLSKIIKPKK